MEGVGLVGRFPVGDLLFPKGRGMGLGGWEEGAPRMGLGQAGAGGGGAW